MATDAEVAKKQKDVQALRDKIAAAEIKRDSGANEANNDVTMAQLEVEEARLTRELEVVHNQGLVSVQKASHKQQIEQIKGGPEAPALEPESEPTDPTPETAPEDAASETEGK